MNDCLSFFLVPSRSSSTPLYPQNVASQKTCPNSFLFHYFHLRLTFESIKELGSASNLTTRTVIRIQCQDFNQWISGQKIITNMVCKSSNGFEFKIIAKNMDIFQECLNTILIKTKIQKHMFKL